MSVVLRVSFFSLDSIIRGQWYTRFWTNTVSRTDSSLVSSFRNYFILTRIVSIHWRRVSAPLIKHWQMTGSTRRLSLWCTLGDRLWLQSDLPLLLLDSTIFSTPRSKVVLDCIVYGFIISSVRTTLESVYTVADLFRRPRFVRRHRSFSRLSKVEVQSL